MSARSTLSLAAFAALTVATGALAQAPGGVQPGGTTTVETKQFIPHSADLPLEIGQKTPDSVLLARPGVAEELKLTDAQKLKFAKLSAARRTSEADFRDSMMEANQRNFQVGIGPVNPSEARREMLSQFNAEADAAVAGMLTPKQRGRLFQIGLQVDGAMAFAREDLQAKLNIDPSQADAIQQILGGNGEAESTSAPAATPTTDTTAADPAPKGKGRGRRAAPAAPAAPQPRDAAAKALAPSATDPAADPGLQKVARLLRKKQMDAYTQMRGEPFGPKPADQATATPPPADATTPAPADAPAAKPAATTKPAGRKSLKDRRGGGSGGN